MCIGNNLHTKIQNMTYYTQRFDVFLDNKEDEKGLFYVYDNEEMEVVSKGYKYSRYAYNLQAKLELGQ